jgi:uridine phosphorylase
VIGTSYHYLPPTREVETHPLAVDALKSILEQKGLAYHLTKTWTTDGIYRETIEKREIRIAEGCDVVEMEAATFFAVAKFRIVICGQILYAGDLVHPEGWDGRKWNKPYCLSEIIAGMCAGCCFRNQTIKKNNTD